MNLRDDLQLIYDWIPEGSRVLDLGCGDGELLAALVEHKKCSGYGIEIDTDSVIAAMSRGVNVIQADLEQGLAEFGDQTFDVIVLSQTIQAMQNTEKILRCLMRVAKQAIVSFPNFGYWRNRFQIATAGICRFPNACPTIGTTRRISIGVRSKTLIYCAPKTKSAFSSARS